MLEKIVHIKNIGRFRDYAANAIMQEPIKDSARFPWHEVTKVAHYRLEVNAMTKPMMVREDPPPYGGNRP